MLTAKEAFGSETATWPSPESPTQFYERIGARVQKNLTDKLTFRNWYLALRLQPALGIILKVQLLSRSVLARRRTE